MTDLSGTPPKTPEEIKSVVDQLLADPSALDGESPMTPEECDAFRAGLMAGVSYAAGKAAKSMQGAPMLAYIAEVMATMARWAPK